MKELDVVVLTRDYPEFDLRAGAIGAIVHDYGDVEGLPRSFIMEFPGPDEPYDSTVETIEAAHLRPLTDAEDAEVSAEK